MDKAKKKENVVGKSYTKKPDNDGCRNYNKKNNNENADNYFNRKNKNEMNGKNGSYETTIASTSKSNNSKESSDEDSDATPKGAGRRRRSSVGAIEKVKEAVEAVAEGIDVPDIPEAQSKNRWMFVLLLDLFLVGVLFSYAFFGGAVFRILEHEHNMESYQQFEQARYIFTESIFNLSVCDLSLEGIDSKKLDTAIKIFENKMNELICDEKVDIQGKPTWTFWSSVFFSATVISTIGKIEKLFH